MDGLPGFGNAAFIADAQDGDMTLGAWVATGPLDTMVGFALSITTLAAAVRRLRDAARSAWGFPLVFGPLCVVLILLWFWSRRSDPAANRFGPRPALPVSS